MEQHLDVAVPGLAGRRNACEQLVFDDVERRFEAHLVEEIEDTVRAERRLHDVFVF